MLRISKLADYATVIMHYLSQQPENWLSAKAIALQLELPLPAVSKILKILSGAKLVASTRGVEGGYRLAKSAHAISMAQVISAVEGRFALLECAHDQGFCTRESRCALKHNWRAIHSFVINTLEQVSLADMGKPLQMPVIKNFSTSSAKGNFVE